jgi:hypothetical protein
LPCSADEAWKVLREFGGIADWHPAIVKSGIEGEAGILRVGAVRRLELADGGVLRERLIEFDDGVRRLAYVFEESPLPVDGYRAEVRVDEVADLVDRCVVRWNARFEVREVGTEAEFEGLVRGLIVQGHEGLEGVVRGSLGFSAPSKKIGLKSEICIGSYPSSVTTQLLLGIPLLNLRYSSINEAGNLNPIDSSSATMNAGSIAFSGCINANSCMQAPLLAG